MNEVIDGLNVEGAKKKAQRHLYGIDFEPLTTWFSTSFEAVDSFEQLPQGGSKRDQRVQLEYFKRKLGDCEDKASLIRYYDDVVRFIPALVKTFSYKLLPVLFDSVVDIIRIMSVEEAEQRELLVIQLRNSNIQCSHLHALRASLWIVKQEILQPEVYHQFDSDRKRRDVVKLREYVSYENSKVIEQKISEYVDNPILVSALENLIDDIVDDDDIRSAILKKIVEIYEVGHKKNVSDKRWGKIALSVAESRGIQASRGDAIELRPIILQQ